MGLHIERRKNYTEPASFPGEWTARLHGPPKWLACWVPGLRRATKPRGTTRGKIPVCQTAHQKKRNMSTTLPMDKLKAFSKTGRQVLSAEFPLFSVNGKVVPLKLILVDETEISKAPSLTTINYIKHFAAEGDDYGT